MSFSSCGHDRRVILLGKALTLSRDHYRMHTGGSAPAQLVSLGYFDSIKIYPLPENGQTDGWLKSAWEHSIAISRDPNPNAYYHPLYIIDPLGKDVPADFWRTESRFLFVTLVHFTFAHTEQAAVTEDSSLFATMSDQVTAIAERAGKWVRALCYHSMDLSDMVVIWKSDSLVTLLNCLNQLYLHESIGDLHSICSFPFPATPNVADESESIPYVSFRFGTRDPKAVASFDKQLNQKWPKWPVSGGYFTTGTEDVDIVFEKLLVSEFLKLIHFWFEDKQINRLFRQAFYESSTHLGVLSKTPSGNSGGDASESISPILTSRCEGLFKEFQSLRVSPVKQPVQAMAETQIGLSWRKSVSSQLSALVDMSRMCVLDGFCYLILDGVETFCRMIKPYLLKGRPLPYVLLEQVQRFIRGWGTLVDQAVRADGQFIQSPGFSPTLYDIPVSLLEFYIAFTTRCIDMMQSPEDSANHYALFLLPKLCRKTKVYDIFQDEPPHDRLLYVDIPLDFLYDPQQILLQLCHEVSHYCGEDMRCRQARVWYFTYTCAHLIAWYFQIDNKAAVDRIYEDLCRALPTDGQLYMENLSSQMKKCAITLIRDETAFLAWQESYLSANSTFLPQKLLNFQTENNKRRRTVVYGNLLALEELGEDMNRVSRLFEEGYADVSMIFMLTPSWEEYLSLYQQELEWLFELYELEDSDSQYAELVQRAAIVLWAVELSPSQVSIENDARLLRFSTDVSRLCQALCQDKELDAAFFSTDLYKNFFPANLLYNVAHYLRECYQKMKTAAICADERAFIKHTFNLVARDHCVYCKEFQQTLAQYEKKLLQI